MTPLAGLALGASSARPSSSTASTGSTNRARPVRVAIIGGGSAGAVACYELLQRNALARSFDGQCGTTPDDASSSGGPSSASIAFEPVVYERRSVAGGIWNFDAAPGPCKLVYDDQGKPWPAWSGDADQDHEPGPMYDGLRTNIPSDVMSYRDEPIFTGLAPDLSVETDPAKNKLFPSRGTVNDYLQSFVKRHKLDVFTRYRTKVVRIRRKDSERSGSGWIVTSTSATSSDGQAHEEVFDKVILASGRCNLPNVPAIPGLQKFQGVILHSAWYRDPRDFVGKRVLVVGNNSSGMDICRELNGYVVREEELPGFSKSTWAERCGLTKRASSKGEGSQPPDVEPAQITVIQSVEDISKPPPMDYDPHDTESPEWCRKIRVVPRIVEVRDGPGNGHLVLEDGQILENVDVIIFATGFLLQFPYLCSSSEPFRAAPPVAPVLRPPLSGSSMAVQSPAGPSLANFDDFLLLYRPDDSLAVLGAPVSIVPFPVAQIQSRYLAAYWSNLAMPLPVLSPDLSPSQPERWESRSTDPQGGIERSRNQPQSCMVGNPSDAKYVEAILSHIRPEARPPGSTAVKEGTGTAGPWPPLPCPSDDAFTASSDGRCNGPRLGEEGWFRVSAWRKERRANGKALRREALGY